MELNLTGFNKTDAAAIKVSLRNLLPHVNLEKLILCGGVAIRHHLKNSGVEFDYVSPGNDIDILLEDLSDLRPSVSDDFLIYHYHDYEGQTDRPEEFFVALVHPETKTKIDIFNYKPYLPFDPVEVVSEGVTLQMRNAEDQLATQVLESAGVLKSNKIAKKWLENIEGLLKISDLEKASEYMKAKLVEFSESDLEKVHAKTLAYLKEHPEQVVESATRRELYDCELCAGGGGFIVEPMSRIYDLLGYVE